MSAPGSRNIFVEVLRETFPKKLRFDKPCQILHAQLYSLSKRHKHKKYIPRADIEGVLAQYCPMPGRPWLQLPVVRQVLCIRFIDSARVFAGRRSWLYTRAVEEEHAKAGAWLERQGRSAAAKARERTARRSSYASRTQAANVAAEKLVTMVEREAFERELLGAFPVATMYQRMVRIGVCMALLLVLLLFASVNTDYVVYLVCRLWWGMDRDAIMAWMRTVTQRHTRADIPDAYVSLLPPPCFSRTMEDGTVCYGVNIAELVSPDKGVTVICIPCPQVGERRFFEQVGQVAAICDAVVMEGVRFEDIDRISPAALLPLRDNTFPALGVHHRFLDILRSDRSSTTEPPMLYPGGGDIGWRARIQQLLLPFELRCVYNPTALSATKGEARVGWGRLRELIDRQTAEAAVGSEGDAPSYVIALPWTVNQIVNIEASLLKHGFKVKNVFPLHWIEEDHMGASFCDYFGIAPSGGTQTGATGVGCVSPMAQ